MPIGGSERPVVHGRHLRIEGGGGRRDGVAVARLLPSFLPDPEPRMIATSATFDQPSSITKKVAKSVDLSLRTGDYAGCSDDCCGRAVVVNVLGIRRCRCWLWR